MHLVQKWKFIVSTLHFMETTEQCLHVVSLPALVCNSYSLPQSGVLPKPKGAGQIYTNAQAKPGLLPRHVPAWVFALA